jgi:Sec-independent protein translocase protein TatA
MAMFGWYMLVVVVVVVVVFNTSKLTHKKLTPWMFGWRC